MNLKDQLTVLKDAADQGTECFSEQLALLYSSFPDNKDEITSYAELLLSGKSQNIENAIVELSIRSQIGDDLNILPLSYIAEKYFHKTKGWLYQRVNGYKVNGKIARFTQEEKEIFNLALKDISKRIGSITLL